MGRVEGDFCGVDKTALFTKMVMAKTGIPLRKALYTMINLFMINLLKLSVLSAERKYYN
jgi:hypothetical protein